MDEQSCRRARPWWTRVQRAFLMVAASLAALAACAPPAAQPAPAASARVAAAKPSPKATGPGAAPLVPAVGIVGKNKAPVGLQRQGAFVRSLHDALPVSLA